MKMELPIVVCCLVGVIATGPPNSPKQATYDTIVVGLGVAGVTAATTLARAGRRVLGLEAQARVGGRVHTVPFGDGLVELGAEWIHGTEESRTYELATQHNVSILPTPMGMKTLHSNGEDVDISLVGELLVFCLTIVKTQPPNPPEPLGNFTTRKLMEYISEKKPDLLQDRDFIDQFLVFANLYIKSDFGSNDWNDLTTPSRYEELKGHQMMSWHRYGYKTFFDIMLNTYNDGPGLPNLETKLGTEVTLIVAPQHPSERVVVWCKDDSSYAADNVIVTVSLGVLKAKHLSLFSPSLPKHKQTAIEKISMGITDKIVLSFDQIWWPENNIYTYDFLWKEEDRKKIVHVDQWTTLIPETSRPMSASNLLTMWISGDEAKEVETLPEEVVKTKCVELLQRFIGDSLEITVPQPTAINRTTWYTNPFTRGSYSFDNLLMPQYPDARAWLGAPVTDSSGVPRVLFAGEATSLDHFSTVHGASETGYKEAARLLHNTGVK